MTPYRSGGGVSLVCTRCGEITPPNPHVSEDDERVAEATFVCVQCLLRMQEMASRGRESFLVNVALKPVGRVYSGGDLFVFGCGALLLAGVVGLVLQGHLFLVIVALCVGGFVYSVRFADAAGRWASVLRRASLALLAVAVAVQGIVRLTPSRPPVIDPPRDLALLIPNDRVDAPTPTPAAAPDVAAEAADARTEARNRVPFAYAEGLEAGARTLPKGFPTVWKLVKAVPVSPFNGGVWTTDDTLTETRVVVESDRLRLGGKSTRQGKPVRCAGVVEPVSDEPAVFVASCVDEAGGASYRVVRVSLPELPSLLLNAPASAATIAPEQRGVFKSAPRDCQTAQGKITVTASTILEEGGSAMVAVMATRSSLGSVLEGLRAADGRACSGMLDKWDGHPRLTTSCTSTRRQALCPR